MITGRNNNTEEPGDLKLKTSKELEKDCPHPKDSEEVMQGERK